MRPLTNGELASFRRCRRQWWLGYHRGLKKRQPHMPGTPIVVGSQFHELLMKYYDPKAPSKPTTYEDFRALGADELTATMAEGYVQWLREEGEDRGLEIKEVEVTRSAKLGPWELWSKADVRFEQAGRYGVMDHKTTAGINDYDATAVIQTQPLHYMLVERLSGLPQVEWAGKFVYGLARRVKRTMRAKPPFFRRLEVYHTDAELLAYSRRVRSQAADMRMLENAIDAGVDPVHAAYPTPAKTCAWDCDFAAVCPLLDQDREGAEAAIELNYQESDPLGHHDNRQLGGTDGK